ncbi:hypothetical protein EA473_16890 [Natrarchaeobius chitinivorans]|uniref:Uncharacterized protein n=1 Tax=Natrarchaeobius chitinivorans TaxID=1679083 RepID=A0A3N6LWU6_NATCH|nr:hypothetical protein EA473_16890 [Natrarchaeobius chitinivorans]
MPPGSRGRSRPVRSTESVNRQPDRRPASGVDTGGERVSALAANGYQRWRRTDIGDRESVLRLPDLFD